MSELTDAFLEHHGVLGMHWGQHKVEAKSVTTSLDSEKTSKGTTLVISGNKTPWVAKAASFFSAHYAKNVNDFNDYTLKDHTGKKVGSLQLHKKSPEELNVTWVGVHKDARGNGYASAAMDAAVKYARNEKFKKVTLEVPGNAPDARHIYEKKGFVALNPPKDADTNDVWGGLTDMELNLNKTIQHSEENVDDFLAHYGVMGMHWGVRKRSSEVEVKARAGKKAKTSGGHGIESHPDAIRARTSGQIARSSTTDALSTKDLQDYVNRVQLEQRYKQLNPSKVKQGHEQAKAIIAIGGTATAAYALAKSPLGSKIADLLKKGTAARV